MENGLLVPNDLFLSDLLGSQLSDEHEDGQATCKKATKKLGHSSRHNDVGGGLFLPDLRIAGLVSTGTGNDCLEQHPNRFRNSHCRVFDGRVWLR